MGRIPLLALLAGAATLAGVAHAQVYKWVDDKGVVNYSSAPPPKGRGAVKLNEDRVTTIPAPEARRDDPAAAADPALQRRVDQLERDAAAQRQSAAQQEAAAAEAQRRWVEQCRAERRVDCDDPSRGASVDPGYGYAYPPAYARPRPRPLPAPAPGMYQPTPDIVRGGGGVVGPYYRPPPSGVVIGPGSYGIGAGYNPASPGGVVLAPGPGGIGAQYVPVPESAAPPRPAPRPRPVPLQQ